MDTISKENLLALWFLKRKQKHNLEKLKNLVNKKFDNEQELNNLLFEQNIMQVKYEMNQKYKGHNLHWQD